ncbi:hypothetical protein B0H15DRAFT_931748 [Mycena belliarum]|uniref:SMP-30/Gluconolactonase/LRE-like region domain-containing protein n=1 Tax=Mycena belliarum TaxID=1033014 RepID=A0AAD6XPH8_9AGAR|nr:hypothetical protein B0H15DRAFT_931748 [Mycena belliae]
MCAKTEVEKTAAYSEESAVPSNQTTDLQLSTFKYLSGHRTPPSIEHFSRRRKEMKALASILIATHLIYESPTGLFLENIAVRPCGKLLLTSIISPTLTTLDPASGNATLNDVYTFPNATGLTGIIEYAPDTYAVVASVLNATAARAELGSVVIWKVDLTSGRPLVTRITGIPDSELINGLSTVPGAPDLVLAADSVVGAVYEISTRTGAARIAVQDAALAPGPGPALGPVLGINGLHVRDGVLYFTNSQQGTFARLPLAIQKSGVHAAGAVEVLGTIPATTIPSGPDDFALDSEGRAWVTVHPGSLVLFSPRADGTWAQETVAGDDAFTSPGPTAAAFGRAGTEAEKLLYVVTGSGQIVGVDTAA